MNKREKGKIYEQLAVKYLIDNNYEIIATNFFSKMGEIDIIAKENNKNNLIFIEVKAINSEKYHNFSLKIPLSKRKKLYLTAKNFLSKDENKQYENYLYRFDSIFVVNNEILHLKNFFTIDEVEK